MTRIKGLPPQWRTARGEVIDLALVPPGPAGPADPFWERKRGAWLAWREEVVRYRTQVQARCARDPAFRRRELALCAASKPYFVNVWCQVYEERHHQTPFGVGWLPAIQQDYMVEILDWLDARFAASGGVQAVGAISKPRDIAATTTICQWILHGFLFSPVFSAKLISRKEELVDTIGDMDSLLERIASHLFADEDGECPLPLWMRPKGLDEARKLHRQHLKISRPASRNRLRGESTSKRSARGGRSTVAFIDEASYIDNLELLLGAVMDSTQCLILCSSESIETTEVFQDYCKKLKAADVDAVLELEYWMNLFHDAAWLARKRAQAVSEDAFRREQLRDAYAGFTVLIYQDFRDRKVGLGDYPYVAPMPLSVGIDPGFDDECALGWLARDGERDRYRLVEAATWRLQEPEFYAHILAGTWLLPSGAHAEFVFADADYHLMAWTFVLPRPIVCGDPAGWARFTGKTDSFYDRMRRRYFELTQVPLDVRTNYTQEQRTHQARWNALRALLKRLDFNNTPGVRHVKNAIEHYRLEAEQSKGRMSEQRQPRHNWASHPTSMMEFLAVNQELTELLESALIRDDGRRAPGAERVERLVERLNPPERLPTMERAS